MQKTTAKYSCSLFRQLSIVVVFLWALPFILNQTPASLPVPPSAIATKATAKATLRLPVKIGSDKVFSKIAKRRNALEAILPLPHFSFKLPLGAYKIVAPGSFLIYQQLYRLLTTASQVARTPGENFTAWIVSDFVQPNAP